MWNTEWSQRKAQNHYNLSSCEENQHAKPYQTPSKYLNQQPKLRNNPITVNTAPDDLKNRKTYVPESSFWNAGYQLRFRLINLNIPILMSVRQQSHPCFSRPLGRINTAVLKTMKIYQFDDRDVKVFFKSDFILQNSVDYFLYWVERWTKTLLDYFVNLLANVDIFNTLVVTASHFRQTLPRFL